MQYANAPPNKKIGDYVWNHQALLGEGAFGKVYLGHPQNRMEEKCAIKQMDKKKLEGPEMAKALANELMILKLLNGKNTCGMLEHYQTMNNTYIIQPFCDGGDFRSYLNKRKKIPEGDALKILKDMLLGMKEMASHCIAHRDMKPENCLINDNVFKIADYGFSTKLNSLDETMKMQCGTPLYMSPQVLLNQPYTTKNDIWALGLIYYEMLFGKTPWDVKSMADLTNMPRTVPVKFPFNISISKMSKKFILGCLQYEEANRLSWPEIFKSDIFTQTTSFNPAHSEVLHFSKEAQYILAKCQNIVVKNKLDIKVMFQKLDKSHDNQLDSHELSVLLKNVESTFTHEHCLEIIQVFDKSKDGKISFEEFEKLVLGTDYSEHQEENLMLVELKAKKVIKCLKLKIKNQGINLMHLFNKLDRSGDGQLDRQELIKLLKTVDSSLTSNEIDILFKQFDSDNSGTVNYQEFEAIMSEGAQQEIHPSESTNMNVSERAQHLLQKLKQAIQQNDLDLDVAFNHFDADHNNKLDLKEFQSLVKVFYGRAELQQIQETFHFLDKGKDGFINIKEFRNIIM